MRLLPLQLLDFVWSSGVQGLRKIMLPGASCPYPDFLQGRLKMERIGEIAATWEYPLHSLMIIESKLLVRVQIEFQRKHAIKYTCL